MRRSIGGSEAVYMCEFSVSGVMSSGEGYIGFCCEASCCSLLSRDVNSGGGEVVLSSWCRVVDVDTDDVSCSWSWSECEYDDNEVVLDDGDCMSSSGGWRYVGFAFVSCCCCERIVLAILSSRDGLGLPCLWDMGLEYSSTVSRIAVVISSRLVYGKQTFSTQVPFRDVISTALSTTSRTSGLMSSR